MARRRFRLNSLSQYSKESEDLVLDTYSAGCGGIVLRWRNPAAGTPFRIMSGSTYDLEFFLDGKTIRNGAYLTNGDHVLAVRCTANSSSDMQLIALQFFLDFPDSGHERIANCCTNFDWVCEEAHPDTANDEHSEEEHLRPSWKSLEFDHSGWSTMQQGVLAEDDRRNWMLRYLTEQGAGLLTFPAAKEIRMRFAFEWDGAQ